MAKLTTAQRNALPDSAFAGPGRSYPVNDKSHAANAKARAAQHAGPALEAKVDAKANKVLKAANGWASTTSDEKLRKAAWGYPDQGDKVNQKNVPKRVTPAATGAIVGATGAPSESGPPQPTPKPYQPVKPNDPAWGAYKTGGLDGPKKAVAAVDTALDAVGNRVKGSIAGKAAKNTVNLAKATNKIGSGLKHVLGFKKGGVVTDKEVKGAKKGGVVKGEHPLNAGIIRAAMGFPGVDPSMIGVSPPMAGGAGLGAPPMPPAPMMPPTPLALGPGVGMKAMARPKATKGSSKGTPKAKKAKPVKMENGGVIGAAGGGYSPPYDAVYGSGMDPRDVQGTASPNGPGANTAQQQVNQQAGTTPSMLAHNSASQNILAGLQHMFDMHSQQMEQEMANRRQMDMGGATGQPPMMNGTPPVAPATPVGASQAGGSSWLDSFNQRWQPMNRTSTPGAYGVG